MCEGHALTALKGREHIVLILYKTGLLQDAIELS